MEIPMPSLTEAISIGIALAVLIKTKLNSIKREDNQNIRDDSETNLVKAQNDAATKFVQDLISEHRRVLAQLTDAEKERTNNAQKIGELSTEVNLLREQVSEIKDLLTRLSKELDESRKKINEREGAIIRLEAERDLALAQLRNRRVQDRNTYTNNDG